MPLAQPIFLAFLVYGSQSAAKSPGQSKPKIVTWVTYKFLLVHLLGPRASLVKLTGGLADWFVFALLDLLQLHVELVGGAACPREKVSGDARALADDLVNLGKLVDLHTRRYGEPGFLPSSFYEINLN